MQKAIQWSSLLLFACVAVVLAGCENKTPRPKTEASTGGSAPVQTMKVSARDASLADEVRGAIANQAGVNAEKLEVDANAGVVRLKGTVDSDDTRQKVHEAAKNVPGVKWVQNQMSVVPSAPVPSADRIKGS
ncbi:MAG TPA: BON domain-containing protein [Burkholderiales bacterium]|nr:BON domain-containing protein [Burkholderiales bacterium]